MSAEDFWRARNGARPRLSYLVRMIRWRCLRQRLGLPASEWLVPRRVDEDDAL